MRAAAFNAQGEIGVTRALANQLNEACHCVAVERPSFDASLGVGAADALEIERLFSAREHLVAQEPVFLARSDLSPMMQIVEAAEAATRLSGYQERALENAPVIARADYGPAGAVMGYDFHLTPAGPKLIEINTNAGGAFINAVIARTQRACCGLDPSIVAPMAERFDTAVAEMFISEWRRQRDAGKPRTIAIVDADPSAQYLYPEFLLAQELLRRGGFDAFIADPAELRFDNGVLSGRGRVIDLVYNRLTDFSFDAPENAVLRAAYAAGAVVVTPNPHNYALHADKRNLPLLSEPEQLRKWGLDHERVARLAEAVRAVEVTDENAERLWSERKRYFFKPWNGYGGKAVYRGDKLTTNVWARIKGGGYIAQELAAPSERAVRVGDEVKVCKADVRLFTYEGRLLLPAARIYQGQTTNFRTAGGGFAPLLII